MGAGVAAGGSLVAAGVVIVANREIGLDVNGRNSHAELSRSMIDDTRVDADGRGGYGVRVADRASAVITDSRITESHDIAIAVLGEQTTLDVSDSVVRQTHPVLEGTGGIGLHAEQQATVHARRVSFEGNTTAAVHAVDAHTAVDLDECVMRETSPQADGLYGAGAQVFGGASMTITRGLIAENFENGVFVGTGATATLDRCSVRSTRASKRDGSSNGIGVDEGGHLVASRTLIDDIAGSGVTVRGASASAELSTMLIRGSHPPYDQAATYGVHVSHGARLRADGLLVQGCVGLGVGVFDADSEVELDGSAVRDTQTLPGDRGGRSVSVQSGAATTLRGTLIQSGRELGIFAMDAHATLSDVLIEHITPSGRGFGAGVFLNGHAVVDGERLAVSEVYGGAVITRADAMSGAARFTASDLFVRDVRSGTIRFSDDNVTIMPEGRTVAYGLVAATGCVVDASRAVLDVGGFGFYTAGGVVRLHHADITDQTDALGAADLTTTSAWTLDATTHCGNGNEGVVRRSDLPTASSLPAPTSSR